MTVTQTPVSFNELLGCPSLELRKPDFLAPQEAGTATTATLATDNAIGNAERHRGNSSHFVKAKPQSSPTPELSCRTATPKAIRVTDDSHASSGQLQ